MKYAELLTNLLIDLQSIFRQNNKNMSLSFSQIIVISSIPEAGIDMTGLSQKLGVDNSTTTRLINVLLKNSLVVKSPSEKDRRSNILTLSDKGKKVRGEIENNIENASYKFFCNMDTKNKILTKDLLSSLHWSILKYKLEKQ